MLTSIYLHYMRRLKRAKMMVTSGTRPEVELKQGPDVAYDNPDALRKASALGKTSENFWPLFSSSLQEE